ncbi:MAG: OmpA family protein [Bacteroidota bacterium]
MADFSKRIVGVYIFLLGGVFSTAGLGQNILWESFIGGLQYDAASKLVMVEDGSIIIGGELFSQEGAGRRNHSTQSDMYVQQLAAPGKVYWEAVLGGTGAESLGDMVLSPDGGVVCIGTTDSDDGDPLPGEGLMDIWVVKLDLNGEIVWQERFGGSGNDKGFAIAAYSGGGYLIGGSSGSRDGDMHSRHHGGVDSWLARITEEGKLLWEKHLGGSGNEFVSDLCELRPGWFVVSHGTDSDDGDVPKNLGKKDAWVMLMDSWGNVEWSRVLGGTMQDEFLDCTAAPNGDILLAGSSYSAGRDVGKNRGRGDSWLVRLKSNGAFLWSQTYGGTWSEGVSSLVSLKSGGYLLSGLTKSRNGDIDTLRGFYDAFLVRVDESGNKVWSGTIGHRAKDALSAVIETPNGSFLGVGFSEKNPVPPRDPTKREKTAHIGSFDMWLVNFNEPGALNMPYTTPITFSGKITDRDSQEPLQARILFQNGWTLDTLLETFSDAKYGEYNTRLPEKGWIGVEVSAPGHMFYGENILLDTLFRTSRLQRDIKLAPIQEGEIVVLGNVYFDPGRWELLSNSLPEMERIIRFMNNNPNLIVELGGHTDDTGRAEDKQQLSLNRAKAVKEYLVSQGIPDRMLVAKGYGMNRPIANNSTDLGRRKNRRVEFKVLKVGTRKNG